jgi:hypothetical protein
LSPITITPPVPTFTIDAPPRAPGTAADVFKIEATQINPDAYCLLSGNQVQHCSCTEHRSEV